MRKSEFDRRLLIRRMLMVCAVVVLLGLLLGLLRMWELHRMNGEEPPEETEEYTFYNGERYRLHPDVETLLVIGLDQFEPVHDETSYTNDYRADFLLLLVFDHEAHTCSVVHLNRDTMAEVTVLGIGGKKVGTVTEQLALAHTYGSGREDSCRNTVRAVSGLLDGLKIDHYVSVTMDAVSIINDAVGGVTLTVLDDLTDMDPALVKGETVTLKGEQALTYVRSRMGLEDSSNVARMGRQRQYLEALYQTAAAHVAAEEDLVADTLLALSNSIVSDMSLTGMETMMDVIGEYSLEDFYTVEGESKIGERFMEFYPDGEALKKLIFSLFYIPA